MGPKKLVICTDNDEVLFTGTSQTLAPSKSGTFVAGEHTIEGQEERLTIPAPPPPALLEDDADAAAYCDDPPTILRAPSTRRSA